jgi:hypothetical protein
MIELLQAFCEAKKDFTKPNKSKKSNHGDYSTVEDINDATQPALQKNNLVIVPSVRDDILTVRLYHTLTGQFLEDVRRLVSEKPGCQSMGSANTYMLKYALRTLLNISGSDDDDDGQNEQEYIDKKKPNLVQEEKPVNLQIFQLIQKNVMKLNMLESVKEKFNIDFSSDKIKITDAKLEEIAKFLTIKKEDTHV